MKLQKYYAIAIILALMATDKLLAWNLYIKNDSDGQIVAKVIYAAPDLCTAENIRIAKNRSKTLDTIACCVETIIIESHAGSAEGQTYELIPPRAGINMTCANLNVYAYNSADGTLRAKAEIAP